VTTTAGVLRYEHAFMRGVCGMPEVQVVLRLASAYSIDDTQVQLALTAQVDEEAVFPMVVETCRGGCGHLLWRHTTPPPTGWRKHNARNRCDRCYRQLTGARR
jgi:hypothetical protein